MTTTTTTTTGRRPEGVLVLDGALGTELARMGCDVTSKLWSAGLLLTDEGRAAIRDVHRSYVAVGADVITTSTYQCWHAGLKRAIPDRDVDAIFDAALALAFEAARDEAAKTVGGETTRRKPPLVAASLGSFGATLADGSEFTGAFGDRVTDDELVEFHLQRLRCLITRPTAKSRPDLLFFETIPSRRELAAIIRAVQLLDKETTTATATAQICVTFSANKTGGIAAGDDIAQCIEDLSVLGDRRVWGVGVNCCDPRLVEPLLLRVGSALGRLGLSSSWRIVAYANGGGVWDAQARTWIVDDDVGTADSYVRFARRWIAAGASVVGGCCETTPEHIRKLRALVDTTVV